MGEGKAKSKEKRINKSPWAVFFRPFKIILFAFLLVMVLGCLVTGYAYLKYQDEIMACKEKADSIIENTARTDFSQPGDTRIYDATGTVIGTINSGHYEYVSIDKISKNLQNAYIAQEDRRFYEHQGIDYKGLLRVAFVAIKNKGNITQGGSTITQQIIKNTYLSQERTLRRKLTEFFTAPRMEEIYTKADILEFYCNTNFFANRCYGVGEASRYYFDKEAKDLMVWEAATLAGISNSPSRYDPVAHPEASLKKRNQVLDNMALCGFITKEERDLAKARPLEVLQVYTPGTADNYQTSYAIHCAAQELMKNEGFSFQYVFKNKEEYTSYKERYQELYQSKSDVIRNGGFEIHTSLESPLQQLLQETVDARLADFTELQDNGKFALQGAAVCVDNKTGYVVAICGGRGTGDEYNRGFLSRRQPGSTIKPLIDYAPAFESGFYYPSRQVEDHFFEGGPKNSSGQYLGGISVRESLVRSLNTVAWQVLQDIGVETGMSYLEKMHFIGLTYQDNGNPSMSIGGFTEGARVVDMAKGYYVLANGGVYSNKTCIIGIESQYEGEIYNAGQEDERIFTEDTAYMITEVLKGSLQMPYGTGYGLGLTVPAAGKTGTTNDNKDAWFCGYSKYYTTAVWMGYDNPKAMAGVYGKTYSGKIWHDFMEQIHSGFSPEDWTKPETVSYFYVSAMGEKADYDTGARDLFSSVAEASARANGKKWKEEEERKKLEAQAMQARQASRQALENAVLELEAIIGELQALEVQNSFSDAKISTAYGLLEQLANVEQYEDLKQRLDSGASRVSSLRREEDGENPPQEIGPGVGGTDASKADGGKQESSKTDSTKPDTAATKPETAKPDFSSPGKRPEDIFPGEREDGFDLDQEDWRE